METSLILLMILVVLYAGWGFNWALVRFVIIPSVAAIWHVTLPFWPVMGLFMVVSILLGGFSVRLKGRNDA